MKFTEDQLNIARSFVRGYDSWCDMKLDEMVWEMGLELNLDEETAEELWDAAV